MVLFGCAAQKPLWGDPESGLVLTYRAEEGVVRQYRNDINVVQDMAMIGQKNEMATDMTFSALAKPGDGENLVFGVTVDEFSVNVKSLRGDISLDASGVVGNGFDMILSPLGDELDVDGASSLTYQTSPFSESSLKPLFVRIFPDLPSQPVKEGDTWVSKSDTTADEGGTKINTLVEYSYTLAGVEAVDGKPCAKITGKMTGKMEGKGSQMGSEFTLGGDLTGSSTWLFAYEEGVLVKHSVEFSGDINLESAMGGFPMKLSTTETLALVP